MSDNKILNSPNNSSSQAHNRRRHCHPAPSSSQPNKNIFGTEIDLCTAKLKRRLNCTHKGEDPTQWPVQNNVFSPFPILRTMLSENHAPPTSPTPSRILTTSFHHKEPLRPPTSHPPHRNELPTPYTTYFLYQLIASNATYLTEQY